MSFESSGHLIYINCSENFRRFPLDAAIPQKAMIVAVGFNPISRDRHFDAHLIVLDLYGIGLERNLGR